MRNRVHVTETTYHVDESNKVVICTLKCDMQMHKHPAYYCFTGSAFEKRMPLVKYDGTFTVKGKARCNFSDKFDVEKGKKIAESRAKSKMFRTAEKVWNEVSRYIFNMMKECQITAGACAMAKSIEDKHLKELEA